MSYALITGASKGIGKSIAMALAAKKIDVLLVARSTEQLHQFAEEIKIQYGVNALYLSIDLAMPDAAVHIFDWCQQQQISIHILVNNAGYGLAGGLEKYAAKEHTDMMQVNMVVPVALCALFIPHFKIQPQAYILNIASTAAYQAVPQLNIYAATKAFVLRFSRGLQMELKNTNISVTCVSPGSTDTQFGIRAQVGEKAMKNAKKVNMTPEAVAGMAVDAMFAKKTEKIAGFVNKLGAFMAWLLPKKLVENVAASLYK